MPCPWDDRRNPLTRPLTPSLIYPPHTPFLKYSLTHPLSYILLTPLPSQAPSHTSSPLSSRTPLLLVGSGNLYILSGGTSPVLQKVSASTSVLTVIAGTGTTGSSGNGGPATLAQLATGAMGCAADMGGNIYVADQNNHAIRQVSPNPSISGSYIMTTVSLVITNPHQTLPNLAFSPSLPYLTKCSYTCLIITA